MANNNKKMVVIAKIGAPHGICGDMRLNIFCNPPEKAVEYPLWYLRKTPESAWEQLKGEAVFQVGDKFLLHLESVSTPEAARLYTNAEIAVERDTLPEASENEYYWADLIGLSVINEDNERLGQVVHLFETSGANDVLVVDDQGEERLIPFVRQYIKKVDFKLKQIIVDWQKDYL